VMGEFIIRFIWGRKERGGSPTPFFVIDLSGGERERGSLPFFRNSSNSVCVELVSCPY
jgi:hypothetical protein